MTLSRPFTGRYCRVSQQPLVRKECERLTVHASQMRMTVFYTPDDEFNARIPLGQSNYVALGQEIAHASV